MRVIGLLGLALLLLGLGGCLGIIGIGLTLAILCFLRLLHREGGLVTASPVILKFSRAPFTLELGLAGVFCHVVVEIPRLVGIDLKRGCARSALVDEAAFRLVGHEFLSGGCLCLLFLPGDELVDESLRDFLTLLGGHCGELQQRILQLDVAGIDG